jgi:oligosaccharide repeat unit polymerase
MGLGPLIILILLGLLTAFNYLRYRDVLYPPVLQAGVWTGALAFYLVNQEMLVPLSGPLFAIIVGGVLLFSAGGYLATRDFAPRRQPLSARDFSPRLAYDRLLFWLPIVGLIPFLLRAYFLAQVGPYDDFFNNLRYAVSEVEDPATEGGFGVLAYLVPISFASVAVQMLLGSYRTNRWAFVSSVLTAGVYAFFATGRTYVMLLLIMGIGILLITRRVSPVRTLAMSLSTGLILFLILGMLVGKGGSIVDEFDVTFETVWSVFVTYAVGSLPALDSFIQAHEGLGWGQNTFRTFYAVAEGIGLDLEVQPLVKEFEFVPYPTNVYTVYQPYFADFALAGIGVAALFFGWLHGYLYRRADSGNLLAILLYALSLYPLFMQFFQDQYFSLLSLWVQFGVLLTLYFFRFRFLSGAGPTG